MSHQWSTCIDKLMLWRTNTWVKCELKSGSLTQLVIYYDQLMITSDTKVLESFNMKNKMKGIYKEDILILIISVTIQEVRKLKFQIKDDLGRCLNKLGEHFPVMHHNSLQSKNTIHTKYRNIDEVLKQALKSKECATSVPLPLDYGNFIKICLLDPTFLQTVLETDKSLQEGIFKQS